MAARTLGTTWKQMEKLVAKLFLKKAPKGAVEAVDDLCRKTNESRIVDAMVSLLVTPYGGLEGTRIRFATSNGKAFPDWITDYNAEAKTIEVNSVGIIKFAADCHASVKTLATPAAKESFQGYRLISFMAELGKIPTRLTLFLLILVQVARCKEICKADKRGGAAAVADSPETEQYQTLLWAFKELETFYRETTGINLRSEYNILWYESEWIAGK